MVDYDYIHALFGGISYFFDVGNSAVNCDYEGTEILFEFIDGIFVEAIRISSARKPPAHVDSE